MKRTLLPAALILLLSPPASAADRSVFLNGVKIDGMTNQTFRGCDVTIDSSGNVLITARGYSIERKDIRQEGGTPGQTVQVIRSSSDAVPPSGRPTKHYFVVSTQNRSGATQYDVDVSINGKLVATVRSVDREFTRDVTPYLVLGPNRVVMTAHKNYGGGARISGSREDFFKIILGEGTLSGSRVTVDVSLAEFRRTADELGSPTAEFQIKAR